MNECLKQHLHDIIFADGTPIKCCRPDALPLSYMFWTRTMLSTSIKRKFTESQCIFAAELVAGIVTLDIFDNRANPNYRVIALDPTLVSSCTVTDVASTLYARDSRSDDDSAVGRYGLPTRVLVSPHCSWELALNHKLIDAGACQRPCGELEVPHGPRNCNCTGRPDIH